MQDGGHDLAGHHAVVVVQPFVRPEAFHGSAVGQGCDAGVATAAQGAFEVVPGRHGGGPGSSAQQSPCKPWKSRRSVSSHHRDPIRSDSNSG